LPGGWAKTIDPARSRSFWKAGVFCGVQVPLGGGYIAGRLDKGPEFGIRDFGFLDLEGTDRDLPLNCLLTVVLIRAHREGPAVQQNKITVCLRSRTVSQSKSRKPEETGNYQPQIIAFFQLPSSHGNSDSQSSSILADDRSPLVGPYVSDNWQ
jgi:hypothetical protein